MVTEMQSMKPNREREQAAPREGETMTNFATRMMIAAATLVVAAGAASAQTMKAEIPFTFQAGDKVMAAGTYRVDKILAQTGTPIFRLKDANGPSAAILMPVGAGDVNKNWVAQGVPVLAFECGASRCSLSKIWTGAYGSPAYHVPPAKTSKDEPAHVALIEMRPEKSE
jgi:hypothetical protein